MGRVRSRPQAINQACLWRNARQRLSAAQRYIAVLRAWRIAPRCRSDGAEPLRDRRIGSEKQRAHPRMTIGGVLKLEAPSIYLALYLPDRAETDPQRQGLLTHGPRSTAQFLRNCRS